MKYFDTAFILKLYLREEGSKAVMELANHSGGLACSDLGYSEFHAGLHRNLREGRLRPLEFDKTLDRFHRDMKIGQWRWIPLTRAIHEDVATVFRNISGSVYLRCADAIHLTTAKHYGFSEICSNDRHLGKAAPLFGLSVNNPIED